MHYPVYSDKFFAFGENSNYAMGSGSHERLPTMTDLELMKENIEIEKIDGARYYSCVLSKCGKVFLAGHIRGINQRERYEKLDVAEPVRLMSAGKYSLMVVTRSDKVFMMGRNRQNHMGDVSSGQPNFVEYKIS